MSKFSMTAAFATLHAVAGQSRPAMVQSETVDKRNADGPQGKSGTTSATNTPSGAFRKGPRVAIESGGTVRAAGLKRTYDARAKANGKRTAKDGGRVAMRIHATRHSSDVYDVAKHNVGPGRSVCVTRTDNGGMILRATLVNADGKAVATPQYFDGRGGRAAQTAAWEMLDSYLTDLAFGLAEG